MDAHASSDVALGLVVIILACIAILPDHMFGGEPKHGCTDPPVFHRNVCRHCFFYYEHGASLRAVSR